MLTRSCYKGAAVVRPLLLMAFLLPASCSFAEVGPLTARSMITVSVDDNSLVTIKGSVHPSALPKSDQGRVSESLPLQHMYLTLKRSPERESALNAVIKDMQNPQSSNYHHWLTADQLGSEYGPAKQDIDTVVTWLSGHGLQVNSVSKSGMRIDLSATASQIRDTFHTEIHNYVVNGEHHIANASNVQIPAALEPVVAGFNSLNDFMPKPLLAKPRQNYSFDFEGYEQYDEAPADFATIYNVAPLYKEKAPITGKGQTVVVLEVTDVQSSDVATFRKSFGLSSYKGKFTQIHPGSGCTDPGTNGAEGEAALDAEWAGAIAPDADVELASCANSSTNFGAFIAAENLLELKTPPPIMSLSYLGCESAQGPGGNLYVYELWQQAAAEGVSVFVAAGDGSAAGCDDFDTAAYSTQGIAANGLASTPYDTATGGTDFMDTSDNDSYRFWTTSNSATGKSAKSYIPEMPWNDSCGSSALYEFLRYSSSLELCNDSSYSGFLNIIGGSGAPSFVYSKPEWQVNTYGNPADGVRDLPDVSLFASNGFWNHAILFCMSDANEGGTTCDYSNPTDAVYNSAGGTSFTAPQFASIQALINQKADGAQGNPAPMYYALAKKQFGTNSAPDTANIKLCSSNPGTAGSSWCTFHDVVIGNNDVPCYGTDNCYGSAGLSYGVLSTSDSKEQIAYPTHKGWDFATGLGSINVTNVVNNWP